MKTSHLLTGITLSLLGCAHTQPYWEKQGASNQDFQMDLGQCQAQAFSLANGNLFQIAIVQNSCLRGKGWYQVQR
jgi:hypothetical protein